MFYAATNTRFDSVQRIKLNMYPRTKGPTIALLTANRNVITAGYRDLGSSPAFGTINLGNI